MAKIKLSLCGILWLSCLFAVVSGSALSDSESEQLENSNSSSNPNPSEDSKCSFKCEDFKALELKNRKLEKSHEEILKKFELLSLKFDEFKNEISSDCGLSLLKPPLRGPPGKQGEKGDKGDRGLTGSQGNSGADGRRGEKGDSGNDGKPGGKGDKGDSGIPGSNGVNGQGFPDPKSITSCSDAMENLPSPRSNKQSIYPPRKHQQVLCDFETDGGEWTIIQKRTRGPKEEFKQNWTEYQNGFGSLDGNFWIGLDNIHALTKNGDQELRIDLEDFEGNRKYAKYSNFSVSDASDFYRLTLTGFSGGSTLQDSLAARHSGKKFSTIDNDNDNDSGRNCADYYGSGWWFDACMDSNLNGLYFEKGETVPGYQGIYWGSWKGNLYSLAKAEMKIRTRKP